MKKADVQMNEADNVPKSAPKHAVAAQLDQRSDDEFVVNVSLNRKSVFYLSLGKTLLEKSETILF